MRCKRVCLRSHFSAEQRLALIYRVHFHSGVRSLHGPLWAPTRHPTTTCVHWPMPFTEEPCWQLVSPCRRAHMKQQPELKPERAEAMVHDPDAQTGLYCPAWHQSLPVPPPLHPAKLKLAQPVPNQGLRPPARKHAYKSPVCIAAEGGSVPAPQELTWADAQRWPTILGLWQSECHNRCLCGYALHNIWAYVLYCIIVLKSVYVPVSISD